MMARFCTMCGVAIPVGGKFCPECGAAVGTTHTASSTEDLRAEWLVRDEVYDYWRWSGSEPPIDVLRALANDPLEQVRGLVARVRDTPRDLLANLAHDASAWVRLCVAENVNTPVELLPRLVREAFDGRYNTDFVGDALCNTEDVNALRFLAADPTFAGRSDIMENPHMPFEILIAAARDPDPIVRMGVAGNTATPLSVVQSLSRDPDHNVRETVQERLEEW